ncbi:MAG: rRNA maturation RNase YbeY [Flavobacteriaceae bacterium]|nr:rRNA maturation RNase YbeY [Flavobacteriaceae bacterium]
MVSFYFKTEFTIIFQKKLALWIKSTIQNEGLKIGEITYIFCDDIYLAEKNIRYLNHNTLTDIISFDYTENDLISGDIFISIDRVKVNAKTYDVAFQDELHRVIIHGILHFCGYNDKTKEEEKEMRAKEDYYLSLRKF